MTVEEAQRDIRRAYVGGGPGAIISGAVWLVAAGVAVLYGVGAGFAALFFGGMLIFPLGLLVVRGLLKREGEAKGNRLTPIALESTIAMAGLFFAAWLFLPTRPDLVFPLAAIGVGTHYLPFQTLYGDRTYWALGGVVTAIGLAGAIGLLPSAGSVAAAVGVVEIAFGLLLTKKVDR